ncbi:MAG: hypothetical protein O9301_10270 [Leptospira sp.]|nr:hypothetical protein [Leptospira sp.]
MKFCLSRGIIIFTTLLSLSQCLGEKLSNDSLLLNAIYQNTLRPTRFESKDLNACVVSATTASGRISVCFQLSKSSCSLDFFNNISSDEILQKRKDDLSFINLNFTNCTSPGSTLFGKYNSMRPPASYLLQDYFGLNSANNDLTLTFTSQESCEKIGLSESKFLPTNFNRLLTEGELKNINSLEVELSFIASTNNACITDLNFQPEFLPTVQSLRNQEYVRGIACSHNTITGYEKCPWRE